MKAKLILCAAALSLASAVAFAQPPDDGGPPPGPGGPGGRHRGPPPLPLIQALDTNHDHVIDANEIANASAALKTLDKNGDGQLTVDEYMPTHPGGINAAPDGAHQHPTPLIVKALDANGDGIIDANEIANASAALKTLDKNGDGKLTIDELLGFRPGGPGHGPRVNGPAGGNHQDGPPPGGDFGGPPSDDDGGQPPPPQDDNGGQPPPPPPDGQ